jgi:hypothetical protein
MLIIDNPVIGLYCNIIGWAMVGYILGLYLPKSLRQKLGFFLYWVGLPISIINFMGKTDLSGYMLVIPITAWIAISLGAMFAWIWIDLGVSDERIKAFSRNLTLNNQQQHTETLIAAKSDWDKPTQGSFLLAMMVGNTAYLGFPVVLSLVGESYFSWAVLYNMLGSSLAVHSLGYLIANRFGVGNERQKNVFLVLLKNPALWSFVVGIFTSKIPLSGLTQNLLNTASWTTVTLSLVMIGIQLSQLPSLKKLKQTFTCLSIKMILVPLVVGSGLMFFGITGPARLTLVLQMAMPPSFATVLYSEAYKLDQDLTTTSVAFGSILLLVTIPIWLWLFVD